MKSFFIAILFFASNAFAQGGSTGNGGDITEIQLKTLAGTLISYLSQASIRPTFPELNEVDWKSFTALENQVHISIVERALYDYRGRPRTAINEKVDHIPIILFNKEALKNFKIDSIELKIWMLHELFNLTPDSFHHLNGFELTSEEDPIDIASVYTMSYRIFHLQENLKNYVPPAIDFSQYSITCEDATTVYSMTHFLIQIDALGTLTAHSILHQMFPSEQAGTSKKILRYNQWAKKEYDRIRYSLVDPERVIFSAQLADWKVGSGEEFSYKIKVQNHRYYSAASVKISGTLTVADLTRGYISGQITMSPLDQWGLPLLNGVILFDCSGKAPQ